MRTQRQRDAYRDILKAQRMRELRAVGFTSDVFPAKYAGKCASSGLKYPVGEPVCFFEGFDKPILATIANRIVEERRRAAAPKCGCGKEATIEPADRGVSGSPFTLCTLCDYVCEVYFEALGRDVTRESTPVTNPEN